MLTLPSPSHMQLRGGAKPPGFRHRLHPRQRRCCRTTKGAYTVTICSIITNCKKTVLVLVSSKYISSYISVNHQVTSGGDVYLIHFQGLEKIARWKKTADGAEKPTADLPTSDL